MNFFAFLYLSDSHEQSSRWYSVMSFLDKAAERRESVSILSTKYSNAFFRASASGLVTVVASPLVAIYLFIIKSSYGAPPSQKGDTPRSRPLGHGMPQCLSSSLLYSSTHTIIVSTHPIVPLSPIAPFVTHLICDRRVTVQLFY